MAHWTNINRTMKYKRSFTLLETIVAIYILLLGLVGAIALSAQSLSIVQTFKQELIATNLAQEGIELVRNKRDSNYLESKKGGGCVPPCNPNAQDMEDLARSGVPSDPCDKRHTGNPRGCYVDWNSISDADNNGSLTFRNCGNPPPPLPGNCQALVKDPATGFYGYAPAGWDATGFDRRIFMIYPAPLIGIPLTTREAGLEDALVRVYVTWTDKFSGSRYILLETALTAHLL